MDENFLTWSNSVCLYDGTQKSLQALICQKSTGTVWIHCMTHTQAFALKNLSTRLEKFVWTVIDDKNYIKTQSCKGKAVCKILGAEYILLYNFWEPRWLFQENVSTCVFELRNKFYQYLSIEIYNTAHVLSAYGFNMQWTYLTSIFDKLNILSLSAIAEL